MLGVVVSGVVVSGLIVAWRHCRRERPKCIKRTPFDAKKKQLFAAVFAAINLYKILKPLINGNLHEIESVDHFSAPSALP